MSPQEVDALRKEVKKLMIDLGLDVRKRGAMPRLAEDLTNRTGRKISRNTLSMALSGFRETAGYCKLLEDLRDMLTERMAPVA
jgi:hypothetical protein